MASSHPACLQCRSVKVKCKSASPTEICDRCKWRSLDCVFEKHRRGRKLGTRVHRKTSQTVPGRISQTTKIGHESDQFLNRTATGNVQDRPVSQGRQKSPSPNNRLWGTEGLQQVGILTKEAQLGKFSLENILCLNGDVPSHQTAELTSNSRPIHQDDPIVSGYLTYPVAIGLFESFIRCLNPYICQLDPKLHTFEYVRQSSSFLLTAILTASSKAFHPTLHPTMRSRTEKLLGKAFCDGDKSVETVQAILIFTYWKEPAENRTWLLVGYAIRMCIELGLHEPQPTESTRDEIPTRKARNLERTWLVLFVYDRSLSLQLGKPWMIERNDLITNVKAWYQGKHAVPGEDLLLAAFVALRATSSEILEMASPTQLISRGVGRSEMMSKMMNNSITTWEDDWLSLFSTVAEPCQRFLVHFYGLHLRLLLNSYTLQKSLKDSRSGLPISKPALWLCSSSAMGMLDQISQEFGPLKQLYFVQDSIHVMTAYAAIFLIKLLVSLPKALRADLEQPSLQAILRVADIFQKQCVTDNTGCAMQSRFLKNVVEKYQKLKTSRSPRIDEGVLGPKFLTMEHTRDVQNRVGSILNVSAASRLETLNVSDSTSFIESQADDINMWENLFSDAGFWTGEGIYLSENFSGI